MTHAEKRMIIHEALIDLNRAVKALQSLDRQMALTGQMMNTSATVRGKAKRASMDATRSLAEFRKISIY